MAPAGERPGLAKGNGEGANHDTTSHVDASPASEAAVDAGPGMGPPPEPERRGLPIATIGLRELVALYHLVAEAERYHADCGHDEPGAAAQCDPICNAWKAWRAVKVGEL